MNKTYWWRIILSCTAMVVLVASYVGPCNFKFSRCLGGNSIFITRTIFHIFLAILIVSIMLFFVNNIIFLKWLRFAIVWIIFSVFLIAITPEYSGGWMSLNPDKELVSIWMGSLFVILSLIQIIWQSWKERKE